MNKSRLGKLSVFSDLRHRFLDAIQSNLPDRQSVQFMYLRQFHRLPNLKNPQYFTEKIAWRKLYQRDSRFAVFADKIAVKEEIAKLVGPEVVSQTIWTGVDPQDMPLAMIKQPYVIKVNHSTGNPIFVDDPAAAIKPEIIANVRQQIAVEHGSRYREWGYRGIAKGIFIEEMLRGADGGIPDDYKFFVYHGKAHFVQVDTSRFAEHRRTYFDPNWNRLPVTVTYPAAASSLSRPCNLAKMIEIAEEIGRLFDFVRIDLYSLKNRIVFGEATFYPGAGLEPFSSGGWDRVFGNPWTLPNNDEAVGEPELMYL